MLTRCISGAILAVLALAFMFVGGPALAMILLKSQFSSESQRKAMPKNAQTTAQFHSSHMLVK